MGLSWNLKTILKLVLDLQAQRCTFTLWNARSRHFQQQLPACLPAAEIFRSEITGRIAGKFLYRFSFQRGTSRQDGPENAAVRDPRCSISTVCRKQWSLCPIAIRSEEGSAVGYERL
jgi:hypothetical protein